MDTQSDPPFFDQHLSDEFVIVLSITAIRFGAIMERYRDVDGDSGVAAYEIGDNSITVKFKDGAVYLYTDASAGPRHIEQMKRLARAGDGLNSYINLHVKKRYARKLS